MRTNLFSIFDTAAKRFKEPFYAPTVEYAIRMFRDTANLMRDDNPIAKFPEDYVLFHVGEFDQESGELTSWEPHSLGVAIQFQDQRNQHQPDPSGVYVQSNGLDFGQLEAQEEVTDAS